jgi:hypothetical protein
MLESLFNIPSTVEEAADDEECCQWITDLFGDIENGQQDENDKGGNFAAETENCSLDSSITLSPIPYKDWTPAISQEGTKRVTHHQELFKNPPPFPHAGPPPPEKIIIFPQKKFFSTPQPKTPHYNAMGTVHDNYRHSLQSWSWRVTPDALAKNNNPVNVPSKDSSLPKNHGGGYFIYPNTFPAEYPSGNCFPKRTSSPPQTVSSFWRASEYKIGSHYHYNYATSQIATNHLFQSGTDEYKTLPHSNWPSKAVAAVVKNDLPNVERLCPYGAAARKYIDYRLRQLMDLASKNKGNKEDVSPLYILPPSPSPHINMITKNDVILGRGCGINGIEGNQQYRRLIQSQQPLYRKASRKEKPRIARCLVEFIRIEIGGRFLKKDPTSGLYWDVGDAKAELKTGQALREGFSGLIHPSSAKRRRSSTMVLDGVQLNCPSKRGLHSLH